MTKDKKKICLGENKPFCTCQVYPILNIKDSVLFTPGLGINNLKGLAQR